MIRVWGRKGTPALALVSALIWSLVAFAWPPAGAEARPAAQAQGRSAPVLAWYYPQFTQGAGQDIADARRAGVDALIVSQTGDGTGVRLFEMDIARAAEGSDLAFTVGIETNLLYPTQESLVVELQRIVREDVPNPRFLRYGGKPVIVFWRLPSIKTLPGQTPQAAWESVRNQVDPNRATLWIAEGGDPAPGTGTLTYLPSFDALHLYSIAWDAEPSRALSAWAQRTRSVPGGKLWVATVMPGGFYADGPLPWKTRERENGAYFEKAWRGALATTPSMVIVTSLNETNEASHIDPRPEWGDPYRYVDINRRFADQYRGQAGGPPVPVATAVPAQPTPSGPVIPPPPPVSSGPPPPQVTVPPPAPGTSTASGTIQPGAPTTLALSLPTGQQVQVTAGETLTNALIAQPGVAGAAVTFDVAPLVAVPLAQNFLGGGQATLVEAPLDIKIGLRDGAGNPIPLSPDVAAAPVDVTLPYIGVSDPNAEFRWLYEVLEDGAVLGYAWAPYEVANPAAGTVTVTLSLQQLQGTLFLPAQVTPGWVQNHDPLVHMWSGPTREARDFGFAGPQWTTFSVVAPQVGLRLLVYSPVVSDYAWIDVGGVGPAGPG